MRRLDRKYSIVLAFVGILIMSAALPARAQYTKAYIFENTTGVSQYSVRAITNGLEAITKTYVYPAWDFSEGYMLSGGIFCTSLTFGNPAVEAADGTNVAILWVTADNSCRLRDLQWADGTTIIPTELDKGEIPGGGYAYWDNGTLVVVITNDTESEIAVPTDFSMFAGELDPAAVNDILNVGFVAQRVYAILDYIHALEADVQAWDDELSDPSINSLFRKTGKAEEYALAGLDKWQVGDEDKALFLWAKAAHQMGNFISELVTMRDKGTIREVLAEWWICGREAPPLVGAEEIMFALEDLPDTGALGDLSDAGPEAPAQVGGLDYYSWSQDVQPTLMLPANGYTTIAVPGVPEGAAYVCRGQIVDDAGNCVLTWVEQAMAVPLGDDTTPPVILGASADPSSLWPPEHVMINMTLDVTVQDNGVIVTDDSAVWYIESVTSNQPELGTGDGDYTPDWVLDPDDVQSLQLRAERSGNHPEETRIYTVTIRAIDMAGNVSDAWPLLVRVTHDQGS